LGCSCLIIHVSVLCPGSYETKYVDEARNYGRDGYLQTLLHALIIWICSVACKTTSQLAFHFLYYIFPMDLRDILEFHLTIMLTCGLLTSKVICVTLLINKQIFARAGNIFHLCAGIFSSDVYDCMVSNLAWPQAIIICGVQCTMFLYCLKSCLFHLTQALCNINLFFTFTCLKIWIYKILICSFIQDSARASAACAFYMRIRANIRRYPG
jgi:hypothetical protein